MKSFIAISFLLTLAFLSCEDDVKDGIYDYHAHIFMPTDADKQMGQTMQIDVEFESHTGEAVEHIKIRIYNADNQAEAYNAPADSHLTGGESHYTYQDTVLLSPANGFGAGDWILEAKVWGSDEINEEAIEIVRFHINE